MKVSAKLKNLRIAPRKVRLTSDLIKGLNVAEALNQLETHIERSNPSIKKLLQSAVSNGENNFGLDKNNLYVYDVIVNAGPTLKRWMPKAYGRAGIILKRTSRIEIILEEVEEGKNRKSLKQLEQEKRERLEEKRKIQKEAEKKEQEEKETSKKSAIAAKDAESREKKGSLAGGEKRSGIASRIFRRKAM